MVALLLFIHLLAVVVWVGGMVFAHFVLRPAATALLQPPQRLPLMADALGRFFRLVAVAVLAILASGGLLFARLGFTAAPMAWHAMLATGLVMTVVFGVIFHGLYPKLRDHVAKAAWPDAAAALNRIRQLVTFNLALGTATIAIAASVRLGG